MFSGGSGIVTPAAQLNGLLAQVALMSVTGTPLAISGLLTQVAPLLNTLDRPALGAQLALFSMALQRGDVGRSEWLNSRVYDDLEAIHAAMERGDPVAEALQARSAAVALRALVESSRIGPTSIIARSSPRTSLGPPPKINWRSFGSETFPAPNAPSHAVGTAGLRLQYFASFVSGIATHDELEGAMERFYEISGETRRRLREGLFVPQALGQFPVRDAQHLIQRAAAIEPKYGQLMTELILQAILESQEWSLGMPTATTAWELSFLYALRRYIATQMLTEEGKKTVLADRALIRVAQNQASLEKVSWHPGRTRRETFEPWLQAMNGGKSDNLNRQRQFIGEGILRAVGWKVPEQGSSEELRLQWFFRNWIAQYHYGALPARGLPYPTENLIAFAMARNPVHLQPKFKSALLDMMRGFYSDEDLATFSIANQ